MIIPVLRRHTPISCGTWNVIIPPFIKKYAPQLEAIIAGVAVQLNDRIVVPPGIKVVDFNCVTPRYLPTSGLTIKICVQ